MNGRTLKQLLMFAGIQLIIALVIFPERFGTELAQISAASLALEMVYYGALAYLLLRAETVSMILKSVVACLVYRLALGFIFGCAATMIYSMHFGNAMLLGFGAYVPGLLLFAAAAPFVMSSFLKEMFGAPQRRRFEQQPANSHAREYEQHGRTTLVFSKEAPAKPATPTQTTYSTMEMVTSPSDRVTDIHYQPTTSTSADNGFERAVRYLCEDWSVRLAVVVDAEGLALAHCKRGTIDWEQWAPFGRELLMQNEAILNRGGWHSAEKLDLLLPEDRVSIARTDENTYLLVVAERHSDDVLNIRIAQAMDMIRKYASERYGSKPMPNAEKYHVSSTQ